MSYKIKPEEMHLTDFKRFGLLRWVARHRCKCGKPQVALALELAQAYGGVLQSIDKWEDITRPARNRQITQKGIALKPHKSLALKYGLGVKTISRIIRDGVNRKWPIKSIGGAK